MNSFRKHIALWMGLLVGLSGTIIYILTTEPSVSWWDCGEFLATSRYLQIGHPPGAPLFSLLERLFMLLAGGDVMRMAFWGNLLSAIVGGATGAFLCWSIIRLAERIRKRPGYTNSTDDKEGDTEENSTPSFSSVLAGTVGSLIYVFCDTAWFSAVESEVYSLSMFFSSVIFWAAIRWADCKDTGKAPRWILLVALLLGLSLGVHELSLLTVPALVVLYLFHRHHTGWKEAHLLPTLPLAALFFLLGLTPLLVIPIRANANTPINEGEPATYAAFKAYMGRDQYSHAPLYPRIWRPRSEEDCLYYQAWCDNPVHPQLKDNLQFFMGYQLEYMYLRYLMWNFSGRFNDRQGFCTLQNGQFITGIPPIDRILVGTGAKPPDSMPIAGHNVYFMLPLLLALIGLFFHSQHNKEDFWVVFTLFIVSGVGLSVYLNHPAYEPRERDYAYVLSFYAFAIWAGLGVQCIDLWLQRKTRGNWHKITVLTMCVPLLMASQNMNDHDRSSRLTPHDVALNYLNECKPNAILLTFGDNDTFPFWYLQYVEGKRTDVQIINLNLFCTEWYQRQIAAQLAQQGTALLPLQPNKDWSFMEPLELLMQNDKITDSPTSTDKDGTPIAKSKLLRPMYVSHYTQERYGILFDKHIKMVGFGYELSPERCDTIDCDAFYHNVMQNKWHSLEGAYIDDISQRLMKTYWNHVLILVDNLLNKGENNKVKAVLDKTCRDIPCRYMDDLLIAYRAAQAYDKVGATQQSNQLKTYIRKALKEQLAYYGTMSPKSRSFIPYTLQPLLEVKQGLESDTTHLGISQ
jgi:hypothetical protein